MVMLLLLVVVTQTGCQQSSLNVSPEEAAQGVIGKITWVRNKAYSYQSHGQKERTYKWNPVVRGQWVETDRRSAVAITFTDGTRVFLGESARLLIDDYVYNPANHQGTADYKFSVGSMRFISGEMIPSAVSIETPRAKIGFTGSDALIFVTPAGETIVNVFSGTFTVREGDGGNRTITGDRDGGDTTATKNGGTVSATGAPQGGAREATVSMNENISVSPDGVLTDKGAGSKHPSSHEVDLRGDAGPPRTKVTWEFTNPEERDPIPRDWTIDVEILDPGTAGDTHKGDHGEGGGAIEPIALGDRPMHEGGHGEPGHGDHPEPGDGGDHLDDHAPGEGPGPDHSGDHGGGEGGGDGGH